MKFKDIEFEKALKKNQHKKVEEFLKNENLDVTYNNNEPIFEAAEKNHVEIFKMLINDKRVRKTKIPKCVFQVAVEECNIEILKEIYNHPKLKRMNKDIQLNTYYCLNLVLKNSKDPKENKEIYKSIIKLLLENSNKELLLELMKIKNLKSYMIYNELFMEEKVKNF